MSNWKSPIIEDRKKWKRWAEEYHKQTGFFPPISVMCECFPGLTHYQATLVLDGLGRTQPSYKQKVHTMKTIMETSTGVPHRVSDSHAKKNVGNGNGLFQYCEKSVWKKLIRDKK